MQLVHERGRPTISEMTDMILQIHKRCKVPLADVCKEFGVKESTIQREIDRRAKVPNKQPKPKPKLESPQPVKVKWRSPKRQARNVVSRWSTR